MVSSGLKDRYGPYPKTKEKRHSSPKERRISKHHQDWLKWKILDKGGFMFHVPCSEH